jgi:hypothetical protein
MPISPELGRWRPGLCSYIVIPCLKKKKEEKKKIRHSIYCWYWRGKNQKT